MPQTYYHSSQVQQFQWKKMIVPEMWTYSCKDPQNCHFMKMLYCSACSLTSIFCLHSAILYPTECSPEWMVYILLIQLLLDGINWFNSNQVTHITPHQFTRPFHNSQTLHGDVDCHVSLFLPRATILQPTYGQPCRCHAPATAARLLPNVPPLLGILPLLHWTGTDAAAAPAPATTSALSHAADCCPYPLCREVAAAVPQLLRLPPLRHPHTCHCCCRSFFTIMLPSLCHDCCTWNS
jgi:hypothetical protein